MPTDQTVAPTVSAHVLIERLTIVEEIPEHENRNGDTRLFNHAKSIMHKLGLTKCVVCGEPAEQHHFLGEKCVEEGIDFTVFRALLRLVSIPHLILGLYAVQDAKREANGGEIDEAKLNAALDAVLAIDFSEYLKDLPQDSVDLWIQMFPLCKLHHTGEGTGIHFLPFVIWILFILAKRGTELIPQDKAEFEQLTGEGK
jgi:hypothetical protein